MPLLFPPETEAHGPEEAAYCSSVYDKAAGADTAGIPCSRCILYSSIVGNTVSYLTWMTLLNISGMEYSRLLSSAHNLSTFSLREGYDLVVLQICICQPEQLTVHSICSMHGHPVPVCTYHSLYQPYSRSASALGGLEG